MSNCGDALRSILSVYDDGIGRGLYPWLCRLCLGFGMYCFLLGAEAQAQSNLREREVPFQTEPFVLDSLTAIPATLEAEVSGWRLDYNPQTRQAQWLPLDPNNLVPPPATVRLRYRVLPAALDQPFSLRQLPDPKDSIEILEAQLLLEQSQLQALGGVEPTALFDVPNLQKSGAISRGIRFANNQNVFVNSTLNLQLDGQLTPDIRVRASITDQNVPFEPEGNTQFIQDFDRIFIQFAHRNGTLSIGDIVLQNPRYTYFSRYYKNVQGALLETQYQALKGQQTRSAIGVAIPKGKFASVEIPPLEGVQGPYRIPGVAGELFLLILANSEKVFLDGRQLQRGFDLDYVINYNTAEITFNPHILITRFSRLRIDYEYSDRNYGRTATTARHSQTFGEQQQHQVWVNFYQEADNPRNPLGFELGEAARRTLAEVEQGQRQALLPLADSVGFSPNRVLYRRTDTLVNGIVYANVFVFSTDPTQAVFEVPFTQVGQGQGNYVRAQGTVNGQVFRWVAPLNGIPQGDFEAVRPVALPERRQLTEFGAHWQLSPYERLTGQAAWANFDNNLFSQAAEQRWAFKTGLLSQGRAVGRWLPGFSWYLATDYEYNEESFTPIDRFRSIEFERDWSPNLADSLPTADRIFNLTLGIERRPQVQPTPRDALDSLATPTLTDSLGLWDDGLAEVQRIAARQEQIAQPLLSQQSPQGERWLYRLSTRERGGQISGWQQEADIYQTAGAWALRANFWQLENELPTLRADWQRLLADLSRNTALGRIGYRFESDKHRFSERSTQAVLSSLMYFDSHTAYWQSSPEAKLVQLQLSYTFREDYLPLDGEIAPFIGSHNFSLQSRWLFAQEQQRLQTVLTYRSLLDRQNTEMEEPPALSARLDWTANWLQRLLRTELNWQTATGRELRREFVFIPVNNGEGTHTWRDDNGDGIQDLNEFYLAVNPDERNFIKIFLPTNDYVQSFNTLLSFRLSWDAPRTWRKAQGWKGLLGRFSQTFSWTANQRISEANTAERLLPFLTENDNPNVLANQAALRSSLFFNRSNPSFRMELAWLNSRQKQLLTNGFEAADTQEWRWIVSKNLLAASNLSLTALLRERGNASDFLTARNFRIQTQELSPTWAWQPSTTFRLTVGYGFTLRQSLATAETSTENARQQQVLGELRWNRLNKINLLASLRWLDIRYQGELNTPASYELLEALQPGQNWIWNLNWKQTLLNGLQLTLNYEGRQSPDLPIVHIGRVQVTALF
ncbi:hypothetical protein [Eisenibacter elegans]|uniref:hypothetical protein n=1 Tax=Eisenibacter elegans TaxID=997 RepID=UPI00047910C1|nr:hypothetical protein [Eisenibacter elegans]